ncbi:MAG: Spo0B domain-containing protein [Methylocystaceae bacterium]
MTMHDSAEVVELVRQIRHDYLNYFQVITGYLELGMPERAQTFINDIMAGAARERTLLSLQPPQLGLTLYRLYMHWYVQGIILEFTPEKLNDDWDLTCLEAQIEKLIMNQGWHAPDESDLVLSVTLEQVAPGRVRMSITPADGEVVQTEITRE